MEQQTKRTAMAELLGELACAPQPGESRYRILAPQDALYQEPIEEMTRSISDLRPKRIDAYRAGIGTDEPADATFIDVYDRDGNLLDRINDPRVDWDGLEGYLGKTQMNYFALTFNAVVALRDLVYVSRGRWRAVRESDDAFDFIAENAWLQQQAEFDAEQMRQFRAEWQPIAEQHQPSWADDTFVEHGTDEEVEVYYTWHKESAAYISQYACFDKQSKQVTFHPPVLLDVRSEETSVLELRWDARQMVEAADRFEEVFSTAQEPLTAGVDGE